MAKIENQPLERDITKAIVALCRARGAWVLKLHGGPFQRAGIPDLLVLWQGVPLFVEVKRPGGEPTRLQEIEIQKLLCQGVRAVVVTSVDEVKSHLENITKGEKYGSQSTN